MLNDFIVPEVQLDKVEVSLPALIPQSVIVVGVAAEVYMEPILIARILAITEYVLKCPEASADVIENAVKHDLYAPFVKLCTYLCKVLVRT